ncbi:PqqD family protein [Phormidium sp. CCY1219]|uniref:PqqD family protein n=1 Tax=Phormidium sp. CCY1219 TaxID=2886104 RepID=UPI002D1F5C27|nr:PqqD family protein [Phormidium sp. CCY1219]MEB3826594.1 PqqD family protein [Phormidium sp. CCY1219]
MSPLSLERKISAADNVIAQDLAGESVLLDLQTEQYFGLDDVGTRIWQTLTEKDSIQSAIAALLEEYDVEPEQLRQDVENLIQELLANGLVEISDS